MKPIVPSSADAAKKWVDVTPGRVTYYEANAPGAADRQNANAIAAAPTFKAAVQAANIDKLFTGGLKGKADKYRRKVSGVGKDRFGPGVQAAQSDYDTSVAVFLTEIGNTDIPARQPRGSDSNYNRSKNIGTALFKKRLQVKAAG